MLLEFIATETGTEQTEYYIAIGVARSDPPNYLTFSRSLPVGGNEDRGVHIELDDQINSGYEKIKSCFLTRDRLRVELSESLGRVIQYNCLNVTLQLSDPDWTGLANALRAIFAGKAHLLTIGDKLYCHPGHD
jgi:hypothetical protein